MQEVLQFHKKKRERELSFPMSNDYKKRGAHCAFEMKLDIGILLLSPFLKAKERHTCKIDTGSGKQKLHRNIKL